MKINTASIVVISPLWVQLGHMIVLIALNGINKEERVRWREGEGWETWETCLVRKCDKRFILCIAFTVYTRNGGRREERKELCIWVKVLLEREGIFMQTCSCTGEQKEKQDLVYNRHRREFGMGYIVHVYRCREIIIHRKMHATRVLSYSEEWGFVVWYHDCGFKFPSMNWVWLCSRHARTHIVHEDIDRQVDKHIYTGGIHGRHLHRESEGGKCWNCWLSNTSPVKQKVMAKLSIIMLFPCHVTWSC